jgi:transposase
VHRRHGSLFERAFCQQDAACVGARAADYPDDLRQTLRKGQKNDYNDAEAIAEAALRPNLRFVQEKSQDQLDLQACHRVRSRLVSRRTATINQIRAFLIEQGIAVRSGPRALRNSLFAILENRKDEISPRTAKLIGGLYEDWCGLDERIETVTGEIEELGQAEAKCRQLRSIPGVGPHHGRIVKTTGDGLLVEFASVVDAARCAVEVQQSMPEHDAGVAATNRIELRIAIILGDVIVEGDDL